MAYFTFDEQTAKRAMKWMVLHDGSTAEDDLAIANDIRDFMDVIGYDECLGLPEAD